MATVVALWATRLSMCVSVSFPRRASFDSPGASEYVSPSGFGAVTTSSTMGPRDVKSTSRVYVTPGRSTDVVTESGLERPIAVEVTAAAATATNATPMRSLRNSTTRGPE